MFKEIDLFESGEDGYGAYRIPGIVVTRSGIIISYCEGRQELSDWSKIDIFMRRSFDNGDTWEEKVLLVDGVNVGSTINNPVMIAEKATDTVHFLYCKDYEKCFYSKSTDDGSTWSKPIEITYVFERIKHKFAWTVIATGPCHGIQMQNGRLVLPVWLALEKTHHPSVVSTLYSDDKGTTWNIGEIIWGSEEIKDPSETAIVELSDGRILLNIRNESTYKRRIISISNNGYSNWEKVKYDWQLVDPTCCAGITRYQNSQNSYLNTILFSNLNSTESRKGLIIKLSYDDCKTWRHSKFISLGGAAYSDINCTDTGKILCFYERFLETERYKYLTIAKFDLDWIME